MLTERVRDALRQVIDPEMGINVVDLGLVYGIETADDRVQVMLTLTSPACPLGAYLRDSAVAAIRRLVPEVAAVEVDLVLDPPWSPERMSGSARRQLGWPDAS